MRIDQVSAMLKYAAWERAKGELRAIAAMHGCHPGGEPDEVALDAKYEQARRTVEEFIDNFEDGGLHE